MATIFSTIIKAVRLRYAVPFIVLLVAVYLLVIHPWMTNWGSTAAERQLALPGDELHPNAVAHTTQAITINATPEVIWQWLAQVGQDRAGFYSYTWLENLLGVDIHNTNELRPEWQQVTVGEGAWRMVPADYLGGVGADATSKVLLSDPGRALALEMWGAHVILPINENTSRLIVRNQAGAENPLVTMVIDPVIFTMGRRMLLGLKVRAEGRPDAPLALMVAAWLGWASTGIVVAALFARQRRRWPWLILPIVVALPAVLMAHDFQAGLAVFIAAGVSILGFLIYGRGWWGFFLVLASVVLLTVLLAPEAFTTIGLAFALLLVASLVVEIAHRAPSSPRMRAAA